MIRFEILYLLFFLNRFVVNLPEICMWYFWIFSCRVGIFNIFDWSVHCSICISYQNPFISWYTGSDGNCTLPFSLPAKTRLSRFIFSLFISLNFCHKCTIVKSITIRNVIPMTATSTYLLNSFCISGLSVICMVKCCLLKRLTSEELGYSSFVCK